MTVKYTCIDFPHINYNRISRHTYYLLLRSSRNQAVTRYTRNHYYESIERVPREYRCDVYNSLAP
jgi:hypothetical protein